MLKISGSFMENFCIRDKNNFLYFGAVIQWYRLFHKAVSFSSLGLYTHRQNELLYIVGGCVYIYWLD